MMDAACRRRYAVPVVLDGRAGGREGVVATGVPRQGWFALLCCLVVAWAPAAACDGSMEAQGPAVADMAHGAGADATAIEGDTGGGRGDDGGSSGPRDHGMSRADMAAVDMMMGPADGGRDGGRDMGVVGSQGCVSGAGLPEGENTFRLDELDRRFILRLPKGYTSERSWPLVLALHGNGGSASYWDGTSGDRDIRGVLEDEAILIVAEAIGGNWRDYDAPRDTWPDRIEMELRYFEEVLSRAQRELCVDPSAIFSMGFSGGGSFSGVLGCRRTDIRAIAAGGAVIYFDEQNCVGRPAAWITIGEGELSSGREAYRDFFRDRAGCQQGSSAVEPAPCVGYEGCGQDTPVHYCQHPGGHVWPGFGSQAMWDFFRQLSSPP